MKRNLSVLLMLRYPTSNGLDLIAALERGLDCADAAGELPIHWCCPIHPLLADSSSRGERVLERLNARRSDRMLPVGFAGAYHPLLQVDELRKELEWSTKNPWNEDLATAFGSGTVPAFFPITPDLTRARSRSVYAGGTRLLALDRVNNRLFDVDGENVAAIPAVTATHAGARRLAREIMRHYRREAYDRLAIIVDGLDVQSESLRLIFASVAELRAKRTEFSIRCIDELPAPDRDPMNDLPMLALRVEAIPNDPASRARRLLDNGKPRGRKRGTNDLIRRRLERLAVIDASGAQADRDRDADPRVDERTLVADMSGIVTLAESEMNIRFDGGLPAGMAHGQSLIVIDRQARSYVRFAGRTLEFATVSSFSFEGDRSRGLRTILALEGEGVAQPGQIIADFYFEDGQTDLLATITVSYPEIDGAERIDEYAVLELPLFSTGGDAEIEAEGEYPGGERFAVGLRPQAGPVQLCGQSFRFRSQTGELSLRFPDLPNAVPEVVVARFRRDRAGYVFCVCPRGSYAPAPTAAFTGAVEQFRLALSVVPNHPEERSSRIGKAVPATGHK